MIDPGRGSIRPVVRRRRTRRHRRNRIIRRFLVTAAILLTTGVSTLVLYYLSPSLFLAKHAAVPSFEQAEVSRDRLIKLNEILSQAEPSRPVYPYSVVPGGVEDAKELKWVADHDPIVAAHYAGFDYDHARVVRLTLAKTVYVSYRIGNHIYWTRRRVKLHKGEKLITDGRMTARGRCANRVEEAPQVASLPSEPPVMDFDEPMPVFQGTASQGPPVAFQSALLGRPGTPGLGPTPLSFYNPFSGGTWVPIAPPPLPTNVCGPEKKKGTTSSGGGTGKKRPSPCGNGPGAVPEPGTWMMIASGLIGIYGLARRKLRAI